MNKLKIIGINFMVVVAMFVVSPIVFAETAPPVSENAVQKRDSRIAENKQKNAIKLDKAQETKLKGVCKASQQKVTNLKTRTTKTNSNREKVYLKIDKDIEKMIPRLEKAGVTITDLQKLQTDMKSLIDTYQNTYKDFETSLQDLAELDCQTDPAAFKATLQAVRIQRAQVVKEAQAIRQFIKTILKDTLKSTQTDLETKQKDTPKQNEGTE